MTSESYSQIDGDLSNGFIALIGFGMLDMFYVAVNQVAREPVCWEGGYLIGLRNPGPLGVVVYKKIEL